MRSGAPGVPTSDRYDRTGAGAAYGSPGPGPAVASRSAAQSRTLSVTACSQASPPRPSPENGAIVLRPRVGFNPTSPQHAAGARIDPNPSVACAIGTIRAPVAAAAPPLEPPEIRVGSHGFFVGPWSCGSHVRLSPSSHVFVRPKMTSPARLSRATCSLSAVAAGVSAKKREPRVIGTPVIDAVRSFIR